MGDKLAGPISPRVTKGALVSLELPNPIPKVIVFQYNPESLNRSLQAQTVSLPQGMRSEAFRLKGPPVETIDFEIELDAADQLEKPDQNPGTVLNGIYAQIASLELMLYPKSSLIIGNASLLSSGSLEIIPPEGPFVLLVYGRNRIIPVRLKEFRIIEQDHDPSLNPIRAKVSISLSVLTYADLDPSHPGYALSLANQILKEGLAATSLISDLSSVVQGSGFI